MTNEFRVLQDGMEVAGASGADAEYCLGQVMHYAAIYSQDGPVRVQQKVDGRWVDCIQEGAAP